MEALLERLLTRARGRCADEGWDLGRLEGLSRDWLEVFLRQGYLGLTCREALEQPDFLWLTFFASLAGRRAVEGRPPSPVEHRPDSGWMREFDYCFLNVRATALEPSATGTFVSAVKLLPVLRTKGIHLAPFFDCNFGNVYCIDSLTMPYPKTIDHELVAEGVTPDEQVRFFVDMAHLAGMVVGFDLEPHTSQFSRVVLSRPELFRWVRLNAERTGTVPADQRKLHTRPVQEEILVQVRAIVSAALAAEGLETVEQPGADPAAIRRAHGTALRMLIERGIWTLPSGTWGGVGLPKFVRYDTKDDYPVFEYRNAEGDDHAEHAFGMLTPFRFYDNLPLNELPGGGYLPKAAKPGADETDATTKKKAEEKKEDKTDGKLRLKKSQLPIINDEVVDWFADVFPGVQDRYGFDFVRLDYVDHVFDAVLEEDPTVPVSDRCIPEVLRRVIARARERRPWTGAMAERMGMDVLEYGGIGFDLLLGIDILTPMHAEALSGILAFSHEQAALSRSGKPVASVQWSVDTHDSGNPLFWTRPIGEVVGSDGMLLRQFVARFATPGPMRRPAYECMGNQDMSVGLFHCNNNDSSLRWVGDRDHCRCYHAIEDAALRFGGLLRQGGASWWIPDQDWFAWAVDTAPGADGWRGRLICVVATERKYATLKEAAADTVPLPVVPSLELDAGRDWDRPVREVYEVLLDGSGFERPMPLIGGRRFRTGGLRPRSFRLYLVRG